MISGQLKNDVIFYLGLAKLPKNKAENILIKLENNIQRTLSLEVLSLLSEENQIEFDKIVKSEDKEKIKSFLSQKIPFIDSLTKVVAQSIVKEFKRSISLKG
jgi:hypothetical protein